MVQTSFPFAASSITTEDQWRAFWGSALGDGVVVGELNQAYVDADGVSGRTVQVATGRARVRGQFWSNDATISQAIAANTSGNPRIDRVVLRNTFGVGILVAVIQGTPAATPVAPALTQNTAVWEISLAQVAVANAVSVLVSANVTDERQFVMSLTRPFPRVQARAAAGQSIPHNTLTTVTFGNADTYDTETAVNGMHFTGATPTRVFFRQSGHFDLDGYLAWAASATGERTAYLRVTRGVVSTYLAGGSRVGANAQAGAGTEQHVAGHYDAVAGDYVELMAYQQSGGGALLTADAALAAIWIGQ